MTRNINIPIALIIYSLILNFILKHYYVEIQIALVALTPLIAFIQVLLAPLKVQNLNVYPTTLVHIVPGWNDYVKEYHAAARNAFWWWNLNKRPRHGIIYHNMRTTRTQFKYALGPAKRAEETERADALAEDLCNKNCDEFWRGIAN